MSIYVTDANGKKVKISSGGVTIKSGGSGVPGVSELTDAEKAIATAKNWELTL